MEQKSLKDQCKEIMQRLMDYIKHDDFESVKTTLEHLVMINEELHVSVLKSALVITQVYNRKYPEIQKLFNTLEEIVDEKLGIAKKERENLNNSQAPKFVFTKEGWDIK